MLDSGLKFNPVLTRFNSGSIVVRCANLSMHPMDRKPKSRRLSRDSSSQLSESELQVSLNKGKEIFPKGVL